MTWVSKQAWLTKAEAKTWLKKMKTAGFTELTALPTGMVFSEDKPERKSGEQKVQGLDLGKLGQDLEAGHLRQRGRQDIICDAEPPITPEEFFPCPRPAWSTVQRGTLTPVPDMVYYKDQLEEINELTARIGGRKALRLKGFYSAGHDGLGEAVEQIMRRTDNEAILVPVSSFAMGRRQSRRRRSPAAAVRHRGCASRVRGAAPSPH